MHFSRLKPLLAQEFPSMIMCLLDEVDSTNGYLKAIFCKQIPKMSLCFAKKQTAGYGQRHKTWLSYDSAWKFSVSIPIALPIHECYGLSSVVGLSVHQVLQEQFAKPLWLKWPNDIWDDVGKLGGVLIETLKLSNNQTWLVIGIGVNLIAEQDVHEISKQPNLSSTEYPHAFLSLSEVSNEEQLFLKLLKTLFTNIKVFEQYGFWQFVNAFKKVDKFKDGDSVIVYDSDTPIIGVYRGVNGRGEVKIELGEDIKTYYSGSVSIRPN